jgi:2-keto-4-pentenoate hydratase/2-oxohepta-3-ene-1,7-dioic acid hydratase in catechol pathway
VYKGSDYLVGVQTSRGILDIQAAAEQFGLAVPGDMMQLIESNGSGLKVLEQLLAQALAATDKSFFLAEEEVLFGPCVPKPEKILCVGLNYRQHALETNLPFPAKPIIFSKFNNALAGHKEIISPPKSAFKIDYEAELVIVMGKRAREITATEALSHVFGYTAGNDVSARDLQPLQGQWLLGKTCDSFAPIGPYLVTADEIADPDNLAIECQVNGEIRQSSNTQDMIFSCAELISYISQSMTLKPGDIIFTGTPQGVILGYPESKQIWLQAGDKVTVTIEKLGSLMNKLG